MKSMQSSLVLVLAGALSLTACGRRGSSDDDNTGGDGGTSQNEDGGSSNNGADGGGSTTGTTDVTVGDCIDGEYSESIHSNTGDISGVAYSSPEQYVLDVLDVRYPVGAAIMRGCIAQYSASMCVEAWFGGQQITQQRLLDMMSTIVHESGHYYDFSVGFFITPAQTISCDGGDTVARGGHTFRREELHYDSYADAYPACPPSGGSNCDFYLDTYQEPGSQIAQQGFNSVLEETVQYVNSLAVSYAFLDQLPRGQRTSARDGILTHLWYVERYLKLARNDYPDAYAFLLGDACWREAILTVWGRAWLYLQETEGETQLELNGATLLAKVKDPELLGEIQRVRDAESSCD